MSQTPNRNHYLPKSSAFKSGSEAASGALLPWNTPYIQEPYNSLNRSLEEMQDRILQARPMLGNILQYQGQKSLFNFAKTYTRTNYNPLIEPRKQEFLVTFRQMVTELLGETVAESATTQLKRYYNVSTAEHNGPLTHPNLVNANLLASLPCLDPIDPNYENIIVLACANISFDNYSFPRGLIFHSFAKGEMQTNQLVFFPRSARPCPVTYYPAYTTEAIDSAKKRIQTFVQEGVLRNEEALRLTALVDEIYNDPSVLACKDYTDQVTKTNYMLWKKMLPSQRYKAPNLVFLEQEKLVNRLLLANHLDRDTVISRMLFDSRYHTAILKYFDGISGAFTSETESGTFLFWTLPPGAKYRVQLRLDGDSLTTKDGSYRVALTPDAIAQAIQNRELIPSTLLSFSVLCFYYGLRLRGGFEQTTYLPQMKRAFITMLGEVGDFESVKYCADTPTAGLSLVRPILGFASLPDGNKTPASAIDYIIYGNEELLLQTREAAKRISLSEAIYRAYPDLYRSLYRADEQDPRLAALTATDIEAAIGLDRKIAPSISLPAL